MSRSQIEWPTDEVIVKEAAKHPSQAKLAEALGVARKTLGDHLMRQGIHEKVNAALRRRQPTPTQGEKVSEEEILRDRVKELEAAARKQRKTDVRDERIIRRFEDATEKVEPRYRARPLSRGKSQENHEHVLLLSDLHAGEMVSREETLGLNAYDWQTMLDRLERIRHSILSFQENRPYPIRKLQVWMLGDMVSGSIHDELAETNELEHEESVVQLGEDLALWLEEFVPHYSEIEVSGVVGNHPRRHPKPRAKGAATNNSDWTCYRFIQAYHRKHPALRFHFPKAPFADIKVADRWRTLLMHGDGIRSTMVDVPWGGIVRYSQKLEAQFQKAGKPLDYICAGHWHTTNAIEGISTKLWVNGSVKGVDEYSLQRFGSGRPPAQTLLTFHPRRGVTDMSWLDCVDQVPNSEIQAAAS